MKLVPNSVSRLASRSILKLNANSPTILVVTGVVGLGATAVVAARATRNIDPILEQHRKTRADIGFIVKEDVYTRRQQQKDLLRMYINTGMQMTRLYAPAIALGVVSTTSVLWGHKILHARHAATMIAYSSLQEQFWAYRQRIIKTLGEEAERDIYNGAHGERVEDPDHPGEYKLKPRYDEEESKSYLRPFFDETNVNWTRDPVSNWLFLKGVQQHMQNRLEVKGHVFVNDVLDALGMERCREGAVAGWLYGGDGDNLIDLGFMTSRDPIAVAFNNGVEASVRLNMNIDGLIWDKI